MVLITGNRNDDGPDSLEATLRRANSPACLPVFTLANPKRIYKDREYAFQVAVKFLEYFLDIENYRGVGRLYVP